MHVGDIKGTACSRIRETRPLDYTSVLFKYALYFP